jgi:sugar fermentation stimulation protein A
MLPFLKTLQKAQFEKRYKRFFVDAVLEDGTKVVAHCPNTGSMKSCFTDHCTVWLSSNEDPKRKLKYTLELIETKNGFIGANTSKPNLIVEDAIRLKKIQQVEKYSEIKKEVKYGANSRIDILLTQEGLKDCYLEVKNVTLYENNFMLFPDAVTERGQKHLMELLNVVKNGSRGIIFFLINRPEGQSFKPADHIDPVYGKLLREVARQGVEVLAYRAHHTLKGIEIHESIPINLD